MGSSPTATQTEFAGFVPSVKIQSFSPISILHLGALRPSGSVGLFPELSSPECGGKERRSNWTDRLGVDLNMPTFSMLGLGGARRAKTSSVPRHSFESGAACASEA